MYYSTSYRASYREVPRPARTNRADLRSGWSRLGGPADLNYTVRTLLDGPTDLCQRVLGSESESILRQVIVPMARNNSNPDDSVQANSMWGMALMMMALCVGMYLTVLVAGAVGGPIAWTGAGIVVVVLALAHLKFMNHRGHSAENR